MNKLKNIFIVIILLGTIIPVFSQEEYKDPSRKKYIESFNGGLFHHVTYYNTQKFKKHPKNVILLIGDGMGLAQIYAGMTANKGDLFLRNFKYCGFCTTHSADNYITDSAAGGTALACGKKTYSGAIGVDENGKPIENIREWAERKGKSTGVVTTALVNHATPAAFLAHRANRNMYEEIALDIINSNVDVAIGGGRKHFELRNDGLNCSESFRQKGGVVVYSPEELDRQNNGPVLGLFADMHIDHYPERGLMLPRSTTHAINILKKNKRGFMLIVEASKIDAGGHQNKTPFVTKEMLDFDQTIGEVLKFAVEDRETLVVVTSDHETGGMANIDGNSETGEVKADFVTGKHTGTPVPVFAFGPGASVFTGFMDNTEIPSKIKDLIK